MTDNATSFPDFDERTGKNRLTICAASARWLAQSSIRSGRTVHAFDLFGDWDTHQSCSVTRLHHLSELKSFLPKFEDTDLIIAGGLESHYLEFEPLSHLACWKNTGLCSLLKTRDPYFWTQRLVHAGLPTAKLKPQLSKADNPHAWLFKKRNSTAGQGVQSASHDSQSATEHFFQQRIAGTSISSLHVSNGRDCQLLGLFHQLIGHRKLGARPFHYCGSIGPFDDAKLSAAATKTSKVISEETGIRGVFGIDWILDNNGTLIPIEINPRITASGEIWERSSGLNLVTMHLEAICGSDLKTVQTEKRMCGKSILFQSNDPLTVTPKTHDYFRRLWEQKVAADIPHSKTKIERGHPIMTIFATAQDSNEKERIRDVLQELLSLAQTIRHEIDTLAT